MAEQPARIGRGLEASQVYEPVLPPSLDHAVTLRKLAWQSDAAGDYGRALELLERLIEVCPDDARAHQDLGLALLRLGRRSDAVPALTPHDSPSPHITRPATATSGLPWKSVAISRVQLLRSVKRCVCNLTRALSPTTWRP